MISIFWKEITSFWSSLIAYIVIGIFLGITGLFLWVFTDTSILNNNYATLNSFFELAPYVFLFLIPAITMRALAEEFQRGTIEFLGTKPLTYTEILLGKFFANCLLVTIAILPTLIYYYSLKQLASPTGNIDHGAILGSYLGMLLLAYVFISIGLFSSVWSNNQVTGFLLGAFLCFFFHWGFFYLSSLPVFSSGFELFVQKLGIQYHYASISRGLVDSRDIVYYFSVIVFFLITTIVVLKKRIG